MDGYNLYSEYKLPTKVVKSTTAYNEPGLPKPPAGWGKVLGYSEAQMERDEGESSPDTDEGMS